MTQPTPPDPNPPPQTPYQLSYVSVLQPHRNAPTLVLLAIIFNFVMCGLDFLYSLFMIGMGVFMYFMFARLPASSTGPPPPMWLPLIYVALAIPSFAVAIVKLIGAIKLKRRSRGAWGWALAAGIAGCTQLWCSWTCILPLGVGIYTIVIVCLDYVRAYLAQRPQNLHAFPV